MIVDRNEVTAAKLMEVIFEIEDNFDLVEKTSASSSRSEVRDKTNNGNSSDKNERPNHSVYEADVKKSSAHKGKALT